MTLALWDYGDEPRAVRVPVGRESVELVDWMGNARPVATPGGTLALTLGQEPVYVRGVSPELWGAGAKRPLTVEPASLTVFPGETARLTARLSAKDKPLAGTLRVTPPEALETAPFTRQVSVPAGKTSTVPVAILLPPDAEPGVHPVRALLERDGQTAGFAAAILRVREPVRVTRVRPVPDAGGAPAVGVTLRNLRAAPLKAAVRLRLPGVPDTTREAPISLPAGGEGEVRFSFPGASFDATRVYQAQTTVTDASGAVVTGSHRVTFAAAARFAAPPAVDGDLGEWRSVPALALSGRGCIGRQPHLYRGADDLSGTFRYAWDARALYVSCEVADDVFLQEKEGFHTWAHDCLQLAFDLEPGRSVEATGNLLADAGARRSDCEIDLALTKNGPEVYRTRTFDEAKLPIGLVKAPAALLAVKRSPGKTLYEAVLPWATLGRATPPKPGDCLGIAATINDRDDTVKELDPKAACLFGGITPTKDAAQFGMLLLADRPADAAAGAARLSYVAAMGQSQPAGTPPLPWTAAVGAATDAGGRLFTTAGDSLCRFTRDAQGRWLCPEDARSRLPVAARAMQGDGTRLVVLGSDERFYTVDAASARAAAFAEARFPDGKGPRAFALTVDGVAALGQENSVRAWSRTGEARGEVLRPPAPTGNWWYCCLGVHPGDGSLLVGSYWPNSRVYRFTPDGKAMAGDWPKEGHGQMIANMGGAPWLLPVGGGAVPLGPAKQRGTTAPAFTFYPSGLAPAPDDGYWIACAQGLVGFDRKGRPTGRRLGGLSDPGWVAAGPDGTVLALLEENARFARLAADDAADAVLASNSNEPWRVGAGWTGRAAGVAWDGEGYLVLDRTAGCLWRFDPDHTAWGEKPWIRVGKEKAFANARALAVGDALAWVLDGDRPLEVGRGTPEGEPRAIALPDGIPTAGIAALAATGDRRLYVATAAQIAALDREGDAWKVAWRSPVAFTRVAALAGIEGGVLVSDGGGRRVVLLDAGTGAQRSALTAADVPGGMEPAGIAAAAGWAFVADRAGHRVLRLRLHPGG